MWLDPRLRKHMTDQQWSGQKISKSPMKTHITKYQQENNVFPPFQILCKSNQTDLLAIGTFFSPFLLCQTHTFRKKKEKLPVCFYVYFMSEPVFQGDIGKEGFGMLYVCVLIYKRVFRVLKSRSLLFPGSKRLLKWNMEMAVVFYTYYNYHLAASFLWIA